MKEIKLTKREKFMQDNPDMHFQVMATQLNTSVYAIERVYDRLRKKEKALADQAAQRVLSALTPATPWIVVIKEGGSIVSTGGPFPSSAEANSWLASNDTALDASNLHGEAYPLFLPVTITNDISQNL